LRKLGHGKIIPVIMEEEMRNSSSWNGLLREEIGNLLNVDMSSSEETVVSTKCEELNRYIMRISSAPSVQTVNEKYLNEVHLNKSLLFVTLS
jgi:hypothetical protein